MGRTQISQFELLFTQRHIYKYNNTLKSNSITWRENKCCPVQHWILHLPLRSFCVLCHQKLYSSSVTNTYKRSIESTPGHKDKKNNTKQCPKRLCLEKCAREWMAPGFNFQTSWENWVSNALISLSVKVPLKKVVKSQLAQESWTTAWSGGIVTCSYSEWTWETHMFPWNKGLVEEGWAA